MPSNQRNRERGVALVLTLIFSILLYIIVAELVVSARLLRLTGENDALLARMRNQMDNTLAEVQDQLLTDLGGQAAASEGGGGSGLNAMPGSGPGSLPGAGGGDKGAAGGDGAGGDEEDPTAVCDSMRDAWAPPQSRADNDLTTYFWVEPENAKLNLLSLFSTDPKWAEFSRDQIVRLIDTLREDTEFDVSTSDADRIVPEIEDWARRSGNDRLPRPPLKSDDERNRELTLPLHLDELLMLPDVTEDLFFDKVLDGKVIRGLESVLTVWTSLRYDPGDPEKNARRAAKRSDPTAAPGGVNPASPGGANAGSGKAGDSGNAAQADPNAPPPPPVGQGIRININFAPRAVLRALMPPGKFPDAVVEAIIRWRSEEDPAEKDKAKASDPYDYGDLKLGDETKRRFFKSVDDLEQVEEFASLADPEVKADFKTFCTTTSDVFSVHLATMFKRNEENRVFVLRRARSVLMRIDDGGEGKLYPIVRFEERRGLRVMSPDVPDDVSNLSTRYLDMDSFSQEERAWNPFLVDFYLPKYQREQFLRR
jgi:hypothetical protein